MANSKTNHCDRRGFLKGAAAGAVALAAKPEFAGAAEAQAPAVALPSAQSLAAETQPVSADVQSDQELADIYAFLLTIPPPPAVDTIPILAR